MKFRTDLDETWELELHIVFTHDFSASCLTMSCQDAPIVNRENIEIEASS